MQFAGKILVSVNLRPLGRLNDLQIGITQLPDALCLPLVESVLEHFREMIPSRLQEIILPSSNILQKKDPEKRGPRQCSTVPSNAVKRII